MLGKFVRLGPGSKTLVLTKDGLPHTYDLSDHVKVTLNGKPADLYDLKAGDDVEVDGQPAVALKVTRSKP